MLLPSHDIYKDQHRCCFDVYILGMSKQITGWAVRHSVNENKLILEYALFYKHGVSCYFIRVGRDTKHGNYCLCCE